jgi:hypothetical protein
MKKTMCWMVLCTILLASCSKSQECSKKSIANYINRTLPIIETWSKNTTIETIQTDPLANELVLAYTALDFAKIRIPHCLYNTYEKIYNGMKKSQKAVEQYNKNDNSGSLDDVRVGNQMIVGGMNEIFRISACAPDCKP